ncbi:MAG: CPBP family intramembrane glutamic endopeptidase, partial [Planctomycetota bacterium]
MAGLFWILYRAGPEAVQERLVGPHPLLGLALGSTLAGFLVALSRLLAKRWSRLQRMEQAFARILGPLPPRGSLLLAASSAWGEEVVFRACLQPEIGLAASAVIFGCLHLPLERELILWTPFALAMGFLLGWLYQLHGALAAPLALHFLVNLLNLRRLAR